MPEPTYTVIKDETMHIAGRTRRVIRLVFGTATPGETAGHRHRVLTDRADECLRQDSDIQAVMIFGFMSARAEQQSMFDAGRVVATRDGDGWTGDGMIPGLALPRVDQPDVVWLSATPNEPAGAVHYPARNPAQAIRRFPRILPLRRKHDA